MNALDEQKKNGDMVFLQTQFVSGFLRYYQKFHLNKVFRTSGKIRGTTRREADA
ncbi:unnamed protein product [Amoebophrya sp. A25]|nr:unnamed protein product [Amoebophrya sp. A25]|eukprot:GSA25T00004319001.1